jgi:hypothetical protein
LLRLGLPVDADYKLNDNEGLLEDAYCHPTYRGKGLHSKMNVYRLIKIYEHGKTKAIAIVLDGNDFAYKSQIRVGFTETKVFYIFKIFGKSIITLKRNRYEGS